MANQVPTAEAPPASDHPHTSRRTSRPERRDPAAAAAQQDNQTWEEFASAARPLVVRIFRNLRVGRSDRADNAAAAQNTVLTPATIANAPFPKLIRTTSFNAADPSSATVTPDPFVLLRKLQPRTTARAFLRRAPAGSVGGAGGARGPFTSWDPFWIEIRGTFLLVFKEQMAPDAWTLETDHKLKHIAFLGPNTTVAHINPTSKNEALKIKRTGDPSGTSLQIRLGSGHPADYELWASHIIAAAATEEPTLADFEIIAPIGKGAAGKVFLVEHRATRATLALKVIDKDTSVFDCQSSFRHAVDERLLMELTDGHPFFVQLRYAFQTRDKLYLVSEFCEGGDLFYFLHVNQRPLREGEARRVLAEVLMALEKLHVLGFVYRDLKPENVLLDAEGHVRLADFGLCKKLEGGRKLGRTHTVCGTHAYVAPEMIGAKSYGVSVDLWTLGVFLYHILVGRPPLDARSLDDVRRNLETWDVKYYSEVMSARTLSLLRGLLDKDAVTRLGCSVKQGIEELRRHPFFKDVDWSKVAERQMSDDSLFPEASASSGHGDGHVLRNFNPEEWAHVEMDPDNIEERFRDRSLWPPIALDKRPIEPRFIVGFDFVSKENPPPASGGARLSTGRKASSAGAESSGAM